MTFFDASDEEIETMRQKMLEEQAAVATALEIDAAIVARTEAALSGGKLRAPTK